MLNVARRPLVDSHATVDFAGIRASEFGRLDAARHAYLDFTGSALVPASLVTKHRSLLFESVLGNPHSESPASLASTTLIALARERVLRFLDADAGQYAVVFTANATAAMGLVGAGYRFGADSPLVLSADNHNSANGIREYAARAGATVHYLPLDDELLLDAPERRLAECSSTNGTGLFVYPAQSNFSGAKHPLSLVRTAKSLGFRVMLDAAAFLPTSRLSLRDVQADFVALSFYKMFGYPTGIGALVARRDALSELGRPWFSGGTVDFVSVQNRTHALRADEAGFEDGTPNFLGIAAVAAGLDFLDALGMAPIERHATGLAARLIEEFAALRHRNGLPLVRVYGPRDCTLRAATVAFNVMDDKGATVPYALVERRAREALISIRAGCFCNPGASEAAFGFCAADASRCMTSTARDGWSLDRFAACMKGYPVGALRASFGVPSNQTDLFRLVSVVESFRS